VRPLDARSFQDSVIGGFTLHNEQARAAQPVCIREVVGDDHDDIEQRLAALNQRRNRIKTARTSLRRRR
jgi:hypothetical protein